MQDNGYYTENARNFKSSLATIGEVVERDQEKVKKTTLFLGYRLMMILQISRINSMYKKKKLIAGAICGKEF